jgi:hypothetical protein
VIFCYGIAQHIYIDLIGIFAHIDIKTVAVGDPGNAGVVDDILLDIPGI